MLPLPQRGAALLPCWHHSPCSALSILRSPTTPHLCCGCGRSRRLMTTRSISVSRPPILLWKMVTRVECTLVKVGKGDASVEQFRALVCGNAKGDPQPKLDIAAWTAPASGLFLEAIKYE